MPNKRIVQTAVAREPSGRTPRESRQGDSSSSPARCPWTLCPVRLLRRGSSSSRESLGESGKRF